MHSKRLVIPVWVVVVVVVIYCTSLFAIFLSFLPTQEDECTYLALTDESCAAKESHQNQEREGVRKDLYLVRGKERLHALLTAPTSSLTLTFERGDRELVEKMSRFQCLMQEEITGGHQLVREFNAATGKFYYQRQQVVADQVFVSRYLLEGETLPLVVTGEKPLMKGVAKSAEFSFTTGFTFSAKHLKASFYQLEVP